MNLASLTSLPLRTKLAAAIAVPVSGLLVLSAVQFQNLNAVVASAEQQLETVESSVAVADVAAAVRTERDVQLTVVGNSSTGQANEQTTSSNSFFAGVRENTDAAIVEALATESLADDDRRNIEQVRQRLAEARSLVGDDLGAVKEDLVTEMVSGSSAASEGSTMSALATFDRIVVETIRLIDIDPALDLDSQTALDLTTLQLSATFDEAIRLEALTYLEIALLEQSDQPESLILAARERGVEAAQLESLVLEIGNSEFNSAFSNFVDGSRYRDFVNLRASVASQEAGDVEVSQITVLNALLAMTNSLNEVKSEVVGAVQTRAIDNKADAEQQLLLGGIALAASALLVAGLTFVLFRSIRQPLLTLTNRSRAISDTELPNVVRLLREEGVTAEVPEIVPIEAQTDDEIGQLVAAFNDMHRTAVELASEQAASRRTVADMFVNLGRRNQRLLMRILDYLDGLERNEENPETLESLFKIDHLATRMRRNAESLLVLAGAREARVFDQPVAMADVVRSALGEVEGYERVDLDIRSDQLLDGAAVADVAHLLAELIENGLAFSPPNSRVTVTATESHKGLTVAVADQGIGMSPDSLQQANETIRRAMTLEETPAKDLGHHVVGRLAGRHEIRVDLHEGIAEGVVAKVVVPSSLITEAEITESTLAELFSTADDDAERHLVAADTAADGGSLDDSAALAGLIDDTEADRTDDANTHVSAEAPNRDVLGSLQLSVVPELEGTVGNHDHPAPELALLTTDSSEDDGDRSTASWLSSDNGIEQPVDDRAAEPIAEPDDVAAAEPAEPVSKPMSVAEASRLARSQRAAQAARAGNQRLDGGRFDSWRSASESSDSDRSEDDRAAGEPSERADEQPPQVDAPTSVPDVPSVLETTSGFALARRRPTADSNDTVDPAPTNAAPSAPESTATVGDLQRRKTDPPSNPLGITRSPGANLPAGVRPLASDENWAESDAVDSKGEPTANDSGSDAETDETVSRFAASLASFQSGIQRATSPNEDIEASS